MIFQTISRTKNDSKPLRFCQTSKQVGSQKVRLDLANKDRQLQAVRFYKKLGFYSIKRYKDK